MEKSNQWDPEYSYKENQHYKNFSDSKEEIKSKYPSEIFNNIAAYGRGKSQDLMLEQYLSGNHRELHKQYLRELADLIFEPNGAFQHLTWDMISEVEKIEMERKARGRLKRQVDVF